MIPPKVSVVIATRDGKQYLREAIASVLSQKFRDLEVVVVDDASSGREIEEVVKGFGDDRVRYYRSEKNLGYTGASNLGLKLARGEYIARIDDDDAWLMDDKLSRQVEFLDNHPEWAVLGTNAVIVSYSDGRELERTNFPTDDPDIRRVILDINPVAHSSALFRRRTALDVGGYDASAFPFVQDYDLWLRLAERHKIANLPEIMVKRRARALKEEKGRRKIYKEWLGLKAVWRRRGSYPGFVPAVCKRAFRILSRAFWYLISGGF